MQKERCHCKHIRFVRYKLRRAIQILAIALGRRHRNDTGMYTYLLRLP